MRGKLIADASLLHFIIKVGKYISKLLTPSGSESSLKTHIAFDIMIYEDFDTSTACSIHTLVKTI